jgi:single-strand DNA-binding protein
MANDLNLCQFIGRLVKDPEIRYATSGTAMCTFTLACGWKTKEKEGTEYIRVVAYQRLAEIIAEYMKKGSQMYIAGRQSTRKYEQDGQTRYSTEVIADQMQMLGHAKGSDDSEPKQAKAKEPVSTAEIEDDIPF